jgi:diguanylate cyclase (GGDEF)-like protein/PAS domain S-box-containing protein
VSEDRVTPAPDVDGAVLLAAAVERVAVGILVVDAHLRVRLWNQWMSDASGISADEAVGQRLDHLFPDTPLRSMKRKVRQVLLLGHQAFFDARVHGALLPLRRAAPLQGHATWIQQTCTLSRVADAVGEHLICLSISDETAAIQAERERRAAHERLKRISRTDSLTQLLNRRTICGALTHELQRGRRSDRVTSVLLFDIDHFKEVNDTHGHLGGDAVLRAVGEATTGVLRQTDQAGRYGGEEFLIVLADTGPAGALLAAHRVVEAIRDIEVEWAGAVIPVRASVGVSTVRAGDTVETLLARADAALYAAKDAGRDCVRIEAAEPDPANPGGAPAR